MKFLSQALIFSCFILLLPACKKKFAATDHSSEEIGRYIAARVPAVIEVNEPVRVRFSVQPDTSQVADVFVFNPSTKGSAYWEDNMTLAFRPDGGWKPGQSYQLQINLDKVIKDVDPKMKRIVFNFEVKPVRMQVNFEPLIPEFDGDTPNYLLRGRVTTSTNVDSAQIQEAIDLKSSGKVGSITWFHSEDGRSHEFVIPSIGSDAQLDFTWQGESMGSTDAGKRSVVVPRSDVLSVLSVEPGNDGQKKIEVHFSQKLKPSQDLNGLVTINGSTEGFTIRKQDHILSIYPADETM
ncbi:MAG: Ig-like domain-containing protein, partial [Saprospiraceae bacterium]